MRNIKPDALKTLAEICIEEDDAQGAFKTIKEIDDLLGILRHKNLINHTKGRRTNVEKRFDAIFRERIFLGSQERKTH